MISTNIKHLQFYLVGSKRLSKMMVMVMMMMILKGKGRWMKLQKEYFSSIFFSIKFSSWDFFGHRFSSFPSFIRITVTLLLPFFQDFSSLGIFFPHDTSCFLFHHSTHFPPPSSLSPLSLIFISFYHHQNPCRWCFRIQKIWEQEEKNKILLKICSPQDTLCLTFFSR